MHIYFIYYIHISHNWTFQGRNRGGLREDLDKCGRSRLLAGEWRCSDVSSGSSCLQRQQVPYSFSLRSLTELTDLTVIMDRVVPRLVFPVRNEQTMSENVAASSSSAKLSCQFGFYPEENWCGSLNRPALFWFSFKLPCVGTVNVSSSHLPR